MDRWDTLGLLLGLALLLMLLVTTTACWFVWPRQIKALIKLCYAACKKCKRKRNEDSLPKWSVPAAAPYHDDDDDDDDDDDNAGSRGKKPQDIAYIPTSGPSISLYPGQKPEEIFDESKKKEFYGKGLHIVDKVGVAEDISHHDKVTKVDIDDGSVDNRHGGSFNDTDGSVSVTDGSVNNTDGSFSDTDGSFDGWFDNDGYNSGGDDVTSSSSDEHYSEYVDSTFMMKHVVLRKKIRNMSDLAKESFANKMARASYNYRLPDPFSIVVIDDKANFSLAIAKEVQNVLLEDDDFLTKQSFDVIHLEQAGNSYKIIQEGLARLWLSCRPEKVVNHLSGVHFV